ncbi:hypothetical protein Val02_42770 [Virgisporangium aliadipatigenens]|uniref:Lipoprotein n=1 Tax=Virgisporangium aliadipatigenens TaxID=741659 RepID=A0A8J3YP62_9ACTN|nr:hypothetical protein [Virgisporangium aliadipatigenens]GIJ47391.1 hypothetical protein Val02_42770 [Virgisporangium aliadipatigenens]
MVHRRFLAGLLVLVALVTACGEAKDDGRGDKEPEAWAGAVCAALTPWRTRITDLTSQAQQQMNAARTAEQAKTGLVGLLGGAESASEEARGKIVAAGVPDASNGRQVATEFADALRRTRDAYANAKGSVTALPTADAKGFYAEVQKAFGQLDKEYKAAAVDPTKVDSAELKKAFDAVPACR